MKDTQAGPLPRPAARPSKGDRAPGDVDVAPGIAGGLSEWERLQPVQVVWLQRAAGNAATRSVLTPTARVLARQPDPFVTGLAAKAHAGDKPGFLSDLRGLAAARAGDAAVRGAIEGLRADGTLTAAEAVRAVALQELGPEHNWPPVVTNFAQGVEAGTFATGGVLPPAGVDALRQFCIERAGATAEGGLNAPGAVGAPPAQVARDYRVRFDARWDLPRFAGLAIDFDPALSSKGPRNRRARAIFDELYAGEPSLKAAYDGDLGGVRELCDTYALPDTAVRLASPRTQELRSLFGGPQIVANGIGHAGYTAFLATVVPKAQALDAADRAEIEGSRQWRTIIERKVKGTNDAETLELFEHTKSTILTSMAPAVAPAAAAAAPPEHAVAPNADQAAFLAGIKLIPPATPVHVNTAKHDLPFDATSAKPNPGLAVRRHIVVEPAAKVISGQDQQDPWPPGAAALPHKATVEADAGAAGHTDFTARLDMRPLPAGTFPEQHATVRVFDDRLPWFKAMIKHGLLFTQENEFLEWAPGTAMNYYGGQLPIEVQPGLPADNPGLTVFMRGKLTRAGTLIKTFPKVQFGSGKDTLLGSVIVRAKSPPSAASDHMELTVEFFDNAAMAGAPMHSIVQAFDIDPALPVAAGADAALIGADNAQLNLPRATAGSLRNHLSTFPLGSVEQRMLAAIEAGTLKVQATIVRSDSKKFLQGPPAKGDPATQVAYAVGQVDPAHTLVGQPNAIGWHWGAFPDHVFLNLTPNSHAPAVKRLPADIAPFLLHEGIHAIDKPSTSLFEDYQTEFRAYWVQGFPDPAHLLSTEFDPALPETIGPRSQRANAIFKHLYDSATYDWVKPAYDNDTGFRQRVDAYLYPDGINLLISARLGDLRKEIETFVGPGGYEAKRAAIAAQFGLLDAAERQEVVGNRVWRDLVETKFQGNAPAVGAPGVLEPRAVQIKTILTIPL